jgi:hypothetical protein
MDRKTARRRAILFGIANLAVPIELIESARERRLFERWLSQGLIEKRSDSYNLTSDGGIWFNQMQMALLPITHLAMMMRMIGSYSQQSKMVNGEASIGAELLALSGASGGVLGKMTAFAYRKSLAVMSHLPGGDSAIRWLGVSN